MFEAFSFFRLASQIMSDSSVFSHSQDSLILLRCGEFRPKSLKMPTSCLIVFSLLIKKLFL